MSLWIVLGALTLAVSVYLLRALVRPGEFAARRGDYDMRVYRRQLDELEQDRLRGVISQTEERAARVEIERRMLQAARDGEPAVSGLGRSRLAMGVLLACVVPFAGAALYLGLGRPDLPAQPLAERGVIAAPSQARAGQAAPTPQEQQGMESVDRMVTSLAQRLEKDPTDYQGWMLLGRSFGVLDKFDEAARAYARAAALPEGFNDPLPHMQLGESLIFTSQGVVTDPARAAFERALAIDPKHPGARFYLALARGQAGDLRGAYQGWLDMARDSPPDAPWLPALYGRLREVARDLGADLASDYPQALQDPLPAAPPLAQAAPAPSPAAAAPAPAAPGPTAEDMRAAAEMSSDDRQAMIRGMVERLAGRMEEDPDNFDGWIRLGRAYGVLGEKDGAVTAYANATRLRPGDAAAQLALGTALVEQVGTGAVPEPAAAAFRAVLLSDPSNPDALWFLGRAAADAGRPDEALAHWERLLTQMQPGTQAWTNVKGAIDALRGRG